MVCLDNILTCGYLGKNVTNYRDVLRTNSCCPAVKYLSLDKKEKGCSFLENSVY